MNPIYKIATVHVSGTEVRVSNLRPITRGITGAVVEILYDDPMWAGLTKKVAFEGVTTKEDIYEGSIVPFPGEVATKKNAFIRVGITGVNVAEAVVIPTMWAELGTVRDSAYGDYPMPGEPVPPMWSKLEAEVDALAQDVEDLKQTPSGGLSVTDDGEGNVAITASGSTQITDDGNGNVVIS